MFPEYPSYAAIAERYAQVNIDEYFSGDRDDRLAIVALFPTVAGAKAYLLDRPTAGSYLICLDRDIEFMKKIVEEGKGFGEHIAKAINFNDYVKSTWRFDPLPKDQIEVIDNLHNITKIENEQQRRYR